jgi:hypothetical protein
VTADYGRTQRFVSASHRGQRYAASRNSLTPATCLIAPRRIVTRQFGQVTKPTVSIRSSSFSGILLSPQISGRQGL